MKQMRNIAIIRDRNGKQIDFERFAVKKPETVKRQMQELFRSPLYRACTKGADYVDIYATPDGCNREATPTLSFKIELREV